MARRFCQECGAAAEPAAGFCATCGARLAALPEPPVASSSTATPGAPAGPPALSDGAKRYAVRHLAGLVAVATIVAVVALLGGALMLDRLARPGASPAAPSVPGTSPAAAAPATAATPAPTSTPSATATPAATAELTTSEPPMASPPYVAGETPVEAVAAFLEVRGLPFDGECSATDPLVDTGVYCTQLVDKQPGIEVHWIGLVGSEPETWLLVVDGQLGWAVVEWLPVEDLDEDPPF